MAETVRVVAARGEAQVEVERSRFIGIALPLADAAAAEDALRAVRREHPAATHHCFAFRAGEGHERLSDDGEPQGTAGLPLLETLRRAGLDFGLLAVVRYYGGRKLGRPGLYRAYLAAGSAGLQAAAIAERVPGRVCALRVAHRDQPRLLRALAAVGGEVLEVSWGSAVDLRLWVPEGAVGTLQEACDVAGRLREIGEAVHERPWVR